MKACPDFDSTALPPLLAAMSSVFHVRRSSEPYGAGRRRDGYAANADPLGMKEGGISPTDLVGHRVSFNSMDMRPRTMTHVQALPRPTP